MESSSLIFLYLYTISFSSDARSLVVMKGTSVCRGIGVITLLRIYAN